jgi:hypothetical protein
MACKRSVGDELRPWVKQTWKWSSVDLLRGRIISLTALSNGAPHVPSHVILTEDSLEGGVMFGFEA